MAAAADGRQAFLDYVERQLVGPWDGDREHLSESPHQRYLTGILFPGAAPNSANLPGDIQDEKPGAPVDDDSDDDPVALSGQLLPSSVALSFVTSEITPVRVEVRAARYLRETDGWRRHPLTYAGDRALTIQPPDSGGASHDDIVGEDLSVDAVWRRTAAGMLVTVALVNRRQSDGRLDPADCLLQVSVRCRPARGTIAPYPNSGGAASDEEEAELALLYRDRPTFAVGHGAAASWPAAGQPGVAWVETSYLPRCEVPTVDFELPGYEQVLFLAYLADAVDRPEEILAELDRFVDGYDTWAEELSAGIATIAAPLWAAASRVLGRINSTRDRLRRGVRLIERDATVRAAFALANRAVLMQMVRTGEPHAGTNPTGTALASADYDSGRSWRPFQLAFILLTIESVADGTVPDRDVVDLLWFPTGGGKTEAYLGIIAFAIFHRRLCHGDDGAGVTAVTRYTLRLLTAQQFQRAAALVCACEMIRSTRQPELGTVPITIGIWVGGDSSPNTYNQAAELLEKIRNGEPVTASFQLEHCPWCGTALLPAGDVPDDACGVHVGNDYIRFACPNQSCHFHHGLPVSSVDEDLYRHPPTVLIGTVDKFARLTWDARAGVFLGAGTYPGPSLIIQDEFHLISGPLGTIVGLYEAAFDVALQHNGSRPKVIASTATIRRADEQSRGVFGRRIELFPPAGLTADESYFVRRSHTRPGRLYVGLMPQGHTPLTAMVHTSAALLQAPVDVPLEPRFKDAYWTLVAYHNSLRELGKTVTLAHDDIPARLEIIASTEDDVRPLLDDGILELTSNIPPTGITGSLERLATPGTSPGSLSFVACTNMISVGVDVSRLGLMLVVGQPKTTAEYLQATSRVGRESPGVVLTLYSPSKPRDRSHYETFTAYHTSIYRFVEPTSVTPFSVPARARALHAGLVVLARHARGWEGNGDAADFDSSDEQWSLLVDRLLERARAAEPDEADKVAHHVRLLQQEWEQRVVRAVPHGGLRYEASGKQFSGLLQRYGTSGDGWPTLDSMRSVDVEVRVSVAGERR